MLFVCRLKSRNFDGCVFGNHHVVNPSGKILRRNLREPYWEGMDRQVN